MKSQLLAVLGLGVSPAAAGLISSLVHRGDTSSWSPARQTSPSEPDNDHHYHTGPGASAQENPAVLREQSPEPTPGPQLAADDLFKRQDGFTMEANTCGFVETALNLPVTCFNARASCVNSGDYRGCCGDSDCSDMKTACVDFATAAVMGSCNSLSNSHTVCCTALANPFCFTYLFSETGSVFSVLACDTTSGSGAVLSYPPSLTLSNSRSGISASDESSASDDSSASADIFTTLDVSGATVTVTRDSPSATSTSSDSGGGSSSTGAIIGGAVGGGIVLVGALALGVFFFMRRRRPAAVPMPVPNAAPHNMPPPPPHAYGQPTSPSSMTYASTAGGSAPPQGYVYPAGYAPPGQVPYAGAGTASPPPPSNPSPVTLSTSPSPPQHDPSPSLAGAAAPPIPARVPVPPRVPVPAPAPAPVELPTHYVTGSNENRAELS
ncbi:uncharacterized protein BROUX77_002490 [Berkeleyomyces rouxiae]|uniref:uncharacterized protein n=1 Tax=Berkeleyomyces rouxiae TaxID=2035830 RepID=UPI003B7F0821